jgi:hypothetical protein
MTETSGEALEQQGLPPPEPEPTESKITPPSGSPARAALWPAAGFALVVAGVALSPFWAPAVAPLLPWGGEPEVSAKDRAALATRLDAIEKRPAPQIPDVRPIASAESALARRVDQLETASNQNQETEAAVAANRKGLQQLEQRLGAIETQSASRTTGEDADMQKLQQEIAKLDTVAVDLGNRLSAIEAQSASRTAGTDAEIQKMQQEVAKFGSGAADLGNRLSTIERQLQAQGGAGRTDAALLVALLQMREAVEQARPFPAEYAAFTALAHDQTDLVAAAEPLAHAAQVGVPGHLALSRRLSELAGSIASATPPPPAADWGAQALAGLSALVTIRRVEGASESGPEAAVNAAERALARSDLGDAVGELDRLSGANAEAAAPWLQMARQRLAVETALAHIQELLAARLTRPSETPASPRTPS